MNHLKRCLLGLLFFCAGLMFTQSGAAWGQSSVMAEAINKANLRSGPGTQYQIVATITSGTQYPVVGRSAHFPWYLLALPNGQGWVFKDLVNITGDINTVPFSEATVGAPPTAQATAQATEPGPSSTLIAITPLIDVTPGGQPTLATATSATSITTPAPSLTPTLTPTLAFSPSPTRALAIYAEAKEESNVRYGPGTDFPRIGTIEKGQLYAVLRRHAKFDQWIEISFAGVAGGRGWVYLNTVTLTGDLNTVEVTSQSDFGYPTLTPTSVMVVTSAPPWPAGTLAASGTAPVDLQTLSNAIYDYMLKQGFAPGSNKQGSAFLLDLKTGLSFSLNPNVAYSGTSLMKIPVLIAFYRKFAAAPTSVQAQRMAEMIICSENLSSNALLSFIGDGDEYRGTLYVSETMRLLGLKNTFLARSFFTGVTPGAPVTPEPFTPVKSDADQTSTSPDPSSQTTPADMGWMLAGIYQCARDGTGPLPAAFPGALTDVNCRRIFRVLRADKIGAMIEGGVPANTVVAHKHGWVDETHGDAGIVFTPGGDYVLTVMLYNKTWLNYEDSFPAIAEISRLVYNAYNPTQQLAATHNQPVPQCSIDTIKAQDPTLLADLQSSNPPPMP